MLCGGSGGFGAMFGTPVLGTFRAHCSRFCSCPVPPGSTGFNKLQQAARISLKRKYLKTWHVRRRLETALGSVDLRLIPHVLLYLFSILYKNWLLRLVEPRGCYSYGFDYRRAVRVAGGPVNSRFRHGRPPCFCGRSTPLENGTTLCHPATVAECQRAYIRNWRVPY